MLRPGDKVGKAPNMLVANMRVVEGGLVAIHDRTALPELYRPALV